MQRLSFAAEATEEACDAMLAPPVGGARHYLSNTERTWKFSVLMNHDMITNEKLALVGNCESLGNWQLSDSVLMSKDEDEGM